MIYRVGLNRSFANPVIRKPVIRKPGHSQTRSFANPVIRKPGHSQTRSFANPVIRKPGHSQTPVIRKKVQHTDPCLPARLPRCQLDYLRAVQPLMTRSLKRNRPPIVHKPFVLPKKGGGDPRIATDPCPATPLGGDRELVFLLLPSIRQPLDCIVRFLHCARTIRIRETGDQDGQAW